MEILKVPSGETKESFIKCRMHNIDRQIDSYRFILDDLDCYDTDTQIDIMSVEMKLLDILKSMREVKI